MISNKTAVILSLIILVIKAVTSTSPSEAQEPSSSNKPTIPIRKHRPISGIVDNVLKDSNNTVEVVQPKEESIGSVVCAQEQPVLQVNKKFERLIKEGNYKEIFELGEEMYDGEFLEQLCPVVTTLEQYNGIVDSLARRVTLASFYIQGNLEVVKGAIIAKSEIYYNSHYVCKGDLETALLLALKEDRHDRVVDLLSIRKGITAEKDKQLAQKGKITSFEIFVFKFLDGLAPWKDGMILKRFLTLHGDELRSKHSDILNTFCQLLVTFLECHLCLPDPKAEKLLIGLIGQPYILTPESAAKGFLYYDSNGNRSNFIKYGWREAIEVGLKEEYPKGGKKLWLIMQKERPGQFPGNYPPSNEVLVAALEHFLTKQQMEEQWIEKNPLSDLSERVDTLITCNILPKVLMKIIIDYANLKHTWLNV